MPRSRSRQRSRRRSKGGSRSRRGHSRSLSRTSSRDRSRRRTRTHSRSFSRSRTPRRNYRDRTRSRVRSQSRSRGTDRYHRLSRSRDSHSNRRLIKVNGYTSSRTNSNDVPRQQGCHDCNCRRLPAAALNNATGFENHVECEPHLPHRTNTPPLSANILTSTLDVTDNHEVCSKSVESIQRSEASTLAQALIEAIKTVRPEKSHSYFVSNFDPAIHNIDVWCEEVDRARDVNCWTDHECLSRVASCLKGDAKVWLSEWVTNDRTWSNFRREFTPLCPGKLDYANILFEAMKTTSDRYTTYAEYARRTLLRLRIISGLNEELRTLIVIRGIDSPQIRAAAANANLTSDKIVSFLSIYTKPSKFNHGTHPPVASQKHFQQTKPGPSNEKTCFICGQKGHVRYNCPKKPKTPSESPSSFKANTNITCTFCKKRGHTEEQCFSESRSG